MALDDDDYVHPDVSQLVDSYFQNFPESWCLRLHVKKVDASHQDGLQASWAPIPDIHQLQTASRRGHDDLVLQEVPIAPLNNPFDIRFLIGPYVKRKDMQGPHIENFNNKVWKRELVHSTLNDIARVMTISYALTWIPQWSLDRMLGLFIQAKFFEKDKLMGHWMPMPEQIRYVCMDQSEKGEFRLILPADALLVKKFPQYGYFWNLFFEQFWVAIKKVSRKCLDDMRSWIAQK
ncbi:MAG: glycosyltransferase family 2 protein [Cyanobacteria bacterium J06627_8]